MSSTTEGITFDGYVGAHGRALERYAFVLTGEAAAAQDLLQTALVKAYRRWRRISRLDYPDAYVRRILTNCFLDQRRRRCAERPLPEKSDSRSGPARFAAEGAGADTRDPADTVTARDEIARALGTLSPHQRAVIVLRYFLGLDDETIAGELGCGQATVRSHASRGLQRMREELGEPTTPREKGPR